MTHIPKPKHCNQNWLDMTPTKGGRICGQCEKIIIDFSKMSWAEIEKIQKENTTLLCGMYKPKQLEYWGREIQKTNYKKLAATTGLFFSLLIGKEAFSQTIPKKEKTTTIIRGIITGAEDKPLPGAVIAIANTTISVLSDTTGHYEFDITNYMDTLTSSPRIIVSFVGYEPFELYLYQDKGIIDYDVHLKHTISCSFPHFEVAKPTLGQRIKRKIKRLFTFKKN